ncbi:MAG: hypothetical protein AVO38_06800 [delta proteobacterium ML8_D]|nr:MAG: hypothetical protein AVO38_06800 [delta proteobacterium ML8_D]
MPLPFAKNLELIRLFPVRPFCFRCLYTFKLSLHYLASLSKGFPPDYLRGILPFYSLILPFYSLITHIQTRNDESFACCGSGR